MSAPATDPQQQDQKNIRDYLADLNNAYNTVKTRPCKVGFVKIDGLERTKTTLVERELERVFDADTLEEVNQRLMEAYGDLMAMDVFEGVQIIADQSDKGADHCDIAVTIQEKGLASLHAGSYVQGGEGHVESTASLINPFGYGERISASCEYGMRHSNNFMLTYNKPRVFGSRNLGEFQIHQLFHDYGRWSSFTELVRGGSATVTNDDGKHSLAYELAWRRLADPSRCASLAVRDQLGDQLKSAVKHTYVQSNSQGMFYPTSGYHLRVSSELSGLGPDSKLLRFVKQHIIGQISFPVGEESSLTLSGEAGLMLPWGAGAFSKTTSISDRFFLGGVGSLRGFEIKGAGPFKPRNHPTKEGDESPSESSRLSDSIGGDAVLGLTAALNFPLPNQELKDVGIFGHLFVNGGTIAPVTGGSVRDNLRQFQTSFRWSMGAGIVWATNFARLEFNLCRVLTHQPHDRVIKNGIQFGLTPNIW